MRKKILFTFLLLFLTGIGFNSSYAVDVNVEGEKDLDGNGSLQKISGNYNASDGFLNIDVINEIEAGSIAKSVGVWCEMDSTVSCIQKDYNGDGKEDTIIKRNSNGELVYIDGRQRELISSKLTVYSRPYEGSRSPPVVEFVDSNSSVGYKRDAKVSEHRIIYTNVYIPTYDPVTDKSTLGIYLWRSILSQAKVYLDGVGFFNIKKYSNENKYFGFKDNNLYIFDKIELDKTIANGTNFYNIRKDTVYTKIPLNPSVSNIVSEIDSTLNYTANTSDSLLRFGGALVLSEDNYMLITYNKNNTVNFYIISSDGNIIKKTISSKIITSDRVQYRIGSYGVNYKTTYNTIGVSQMGQDLIVKRGTNKIIFSNIFNNNNYYIYSISSDDGLKGDDLGLDRGPYSSWQTVNAYHIESLMKANIEQYDVNDTYVLIIDPSTGKYIVINKLTGEITLDNSSSNYQTTYYRASNSSWNRTFSFTHQGVLGDNSIQVFNLVGNYIRGSPVSPDYFGSIVFVGNKAIKIDLSLAYSHIFPKSRYSSRAYNDAYRSISNFIIPNKEFNTIEVDVVRAVDNNRNTRGNDNVPYKYKTIYKFDNNGNLIFREKVFANTSTVKYFSNGRYIYGEKIDTLTGEYGYCGRQSCYDVRTKNFLFDLEEGKYYENTFNSNVNVLPSDIDLGNNMLINKKLQLYEVSDYDKGDLHFKKYTGIGSSQTYLQLKSNPNVILPTSFVFGTNENNLVYYKITSFGFASYTYATFYNINNNVIQTSVVVGARAGRNFSSVDESMVKYDKQRNIFFYSYYSNNSRRSFSMLYFYFTKEDGSKTFISQRNQYRIWSNGRKYDYNWKNKAFFPNLIIPNDINERIDLGNGHYLRYIGNGRNVYE